MHYFQHILFQKDHPNFTDKQAVHLPTNHRFWAWSQKLANNRIDILEYGKDNEFILPVTKDKINQDYHHLTQDIHKPIPNACVLLLITDENHPKILLTRRESSLSSHGGEVSLVGGKKDDNDYSSYQVALREASEEIALPKDATQLIGFLPMQFSKKGLLVRPIVACINPDVGRSLFGNPDEIAKIFWVDLGFLQNNPPQNHVFKRTVNRQSIDMHTPAWSIQDNNESEIIWGLTGRILGNFLHIVAGVPQISWYFRQN